MSRLDLSIVNFSNEPDRLVMQAIRAVNRQLEEDFRPLWGAGYHCHAHPTALVQREISSMEPERLSADAVLYLVDHSHIASALEYHAVNCANLPVAFVFTDLGDWTVALSHEVLEMSIDPRANVFVPGPDPRPSNNPDAWLWHTYEACDPVECTVYEIDGVAVSNFVTPGYFCEGESVSARNDFLGVGIRPFGLLPGCQLRTVDPVSYRWVTIQVEQPLPGAAPLNKERLASFAVDGQRPRAGALEDEILNEWKSQHPHHAAGLAQLTSLSRCGRKEQSMWMRRCGRKAWAAARHPHSEVITMRG